MNSFSIVHALDISEKNYLEYIQEWEETSEKIVPKASGRNSKSFEELRRTWKEDETELAFQKGFVPSSLFFLVSESNEIIGALHFRHELNERLKIIGGHIGYGIRPSQRNRGYAKQFLERFIDRDDLINLGEIILTCDEDNIASKRTIEACGGVLEAKFIHDGTKCVRYRIQRNT